MESGMGRKLVWWTNLVNFSAMPPNMMRILLLELLLVFKVSNTNTIIMVHSSGGNAGIDSSTKQKRPGMDCGDFNFGRISAIEMGGIVICCCTYIVPLVDGYNR